MISGISLKKEGNVGINIQASSDDLIQRIVVVGNETVGKVKTGGKKFGYRWDDEVKQKQIKPRKISEAFEEHLEKSEVKKALEISC